MPLILAVWQSALAGNWIAISLVASFAFLCASFVAIPIAERVAYRRLKARVRLRYVRSA